LPVLFMTLCGLGLWLLISLPVVSDLLRSLVG